MSDAAALPLLYERRSCSTCLRARRWLNAHAVKYEARDIFRQPLSEPELVALAARAGAAARIFSWKSPSARGLRVEPGTGSEAQLVRLMAGEPRLIRRPILVYDKGMVIGADAAALAAAFG